MSLLTTVRLGFGIPLLVSALIGVISYRTASEIPEASRWVEHTNAVIGKLKDTTSAITELVAIQRNSLQMGQLPGEEWTRSSKAVNEKLASLRYVVEDNATQAARADELGRLISRWEEIMKAAIEVRKAQGLPAAAELFKRDEVKKLGARVKTLLRELDDTQNELLRQRSLQAKKSAERAMSFIGGGSILVLLFGVMAAAWISRRVTKPVRQLVRAAEYIGAGSLEHRTPVQSNDELGTLATAFNEMSAKLQAAGEDVRSQSAILRCVLDRMGEGVVVADSNGKFLLFNPAAEQMLGFGAVETTPNEWANIYGAFDPDGNRYPEDQVPLVRAIAGESVDGIELLVRNERVPQGAWLNLNGRPLKGEDGHVWGGVIVFRDVTEKKKAEEHLQTAKKEAERANTSKSEFLSRMSHELRTPLNSILGFAQVLQMGQLSDRSIECVDHILKGGRHLLGLIDEVLDISRIEAGKLGLSVEPVQVSDAMAQAVDMIRPMAERSGIVITCEGSSGDHYVAADRRRLHQILLNLLTNAVNYNRRAGSVRVAFGRSDAGRVRIEITDTGAGISSEDQVRLFIPFERLSATQTNVQGTGLGLALCKRLVEAMDGQIGMASVVGAGTTFWVELPWAEAPTERLEREGGTALAALSHSVENCSTVLYIEDNLSNVRLMEHVLIHRPYVKLVAAMQARLGLELAFEHRPDLIFLDLHLPDLTGDVVLRQLRCDDRTAAIPTVIISADATPGEVRRLLDMGATDYMTKPFDVQKLLAMLDMTLLKEPVTIAASDVSAVEWKY